MTSPLAAAPSEIILKVDGFMITSPDALATLKVTGFSDIDHSCRTTLIDMCQRECMVDHRAGLSANSVAYIASTDAARSKSMSVR